MLATFITVACSSQDSGGGATAGGNGGSANGSAGAAAAGNAGVPGSAGSNAPYFVIPLGTPESEWYTASGVELGQTCRACLGTHARVRERTQAIPEFLRDLAVD